MGERAGRISRRIRLFGGIKLVKMDFGCFSGFGGPQSMFATETMMRHLAEEFGLDVDEVNSSTFSDESKRSVPRGEHVQTGR